MIRRPLKNPERRKISTYDFEWRKQTLELTCAGAYDENGPRVYKSLEAFCLGELTKENDGRRFYAHCGGLADMVLLLRVLIRDKTLRIRGCFSGSSAIVVTVQRGDMRWQFVDSYWTMRVPLAQIGDWIGLPKLDCDTETAPWSVLSEYCVRDCELLWRALIAFQTLILDRGGELGMTAASTAMNLFLRRYLERPLENNAEIDAFARASYQSSRVEPFLLKVERANVYDVNSMFPYAGTFPIPGRCTHTDKKLGDTGLWIAEVDVRVPPQDIPPLPMRTPKYGRVYYPTGSYRTTITSEDAKCSGFEIERVHRAMHFEERLDMAPFFEDMFKLRNEGDSFSSPTFKILANSLYGKTAERAEKEVLLIRPKHRPPEAEVLDRDIYLTSEEKELDHVHVPIASVITSRARYILRDDHMLPAKIVAYCDTDSITTPSTLPTSKGLGGLKHEAEIEAGLFYGPKAYTYRKNDGKDVVKLKGFSRVVQEDGTSQRLTYQDFIGLTEGDSLEVERMYRVRELLRREGGSYTPAIGHVIKRLRKPRPKRAVEPDGVHTRAWDVSELTGE